MAWFFCRVLALGSSLKSNLAKSIVCHSDMTSYISGWRSLHIVQHMVVLLGTGVSFTIVTSFSITKADIGADKLILQIYAEIWEYMLQCFQKKLAVTIDIFCYDSPVSLQNSTNPYKNKYRRNIDWPLQNQFTVLFQIKFLQINLQLFDESWIAVCEEATI